MWEDELLCTRRVHSTAMKIKKRKLQAEGCSIHLRGASWLNEIENDMLVAKEIFTMSIRVTFWEWAGGSRLIFWRWNPEYRKEARDSKAIWFKGKYPIYAKHGHLI